MQNTGSVTAWLGQLRDGDSAAADALWERYFRRLQGQARAKLPAALRKSGGDEAVASDAFASLWARRRRRPLPGIGRPRPALATLASDHHPQGVPPGPDGIPRTSHAIRRGRVAPSIESRSGARFETQAAEECQRLMATLGDSTLESVAHLRMDGATVPEIARRLGCSPRTVDRKLALIQTIWSKELPE